MPNPVRRIGLFGTGEMAAAHVRAWHRLGIDVLVCSRSTERGARFARTHDVDFTCDSDTLLNEVDLVDVCTPTDTHAGLTIRAAAAGRHVICEKPLARDHASGERMLAACRSAGVRLFVGHTLRFVPAYAAAHALVREGRVGPVREVRLTRNGGLPGGAWYADPARSGGVLVDLAIHDLDYARWIAGEVVGVDASLAVGPDGGPPISGEVRLDHATGAETAVRVAWETPDSPYRSTVWIRGEQGELWIAEDSDVVTDESGRTVYEPDQATRDEPLHALQFTEFLASLDGAAEPRVTAADGLVALGIALDAERSACGHAEGPTNVGNSD